MDQSLTELCETFLHYNQVISDTFSFSYQSIIPACSYYFLNANEEPDAESLRICRKMLKERFSMVNAFRGNGELFFVSILASSEEPDVLLDQANYAFDALRQYFKFNAYLPILAFIYAKYADTDDYLYLAQRTRDIFDTLNESHPFLTSYEDVVFSGLYAMDKRNLNSLLQDTEIAFQFLKSKFPLHQNAMMSLSQALTFSLGEPIAKCERVIAFDEKLREVNIKYERGFKYVALGILANLGIHHDQLFDDFLFVDSFLQQHREQYSVLRYGTKARYFHVVLILTTYYMSDNTEITISIIIAILLEIEAQQAAAASAAA